MTSMYDIQTVLFDPNKVTDFRLYSKEGYTII